MLLICVVTTLSVVEKLVESATCRYDNLSSGSSAFKAARDGCDSVDGSSGAAASGSKELASVECRLETKDLWDKFHELGTEMIITKTGR